MSEDKQTGYVTVSIDHQSPVVAAQWVNWLVEDVNAAVKAQDVAEAEKSIEYLKQQVANTSLADLQAMFFELIQSQTETVMLAEVRPEYVFKTIDPAVVPEEKVNPVVPDLRVGYAVGWDVGCGHCLDTALRAVRVGGLRCSRPVIASHLETLLNDFTGAQAPVTFAAFVGLNAAINH